MRNAHESQTEVENCFGCALSDKVQLCLVVNKGSASIRNSQNQQIIKSSNNPHIRKVMISFMVPVQ